MLQTPLVRLYELPSFDFREAFNLVDHHLLIAKLFRLGVQPTIVNRIINFLRDRQQMAKLNGDCFSSWLNVLAAVRQETRLGRGSL